MSQFSIKSGDTSPDIKVQLLNENRDPKNLQTVSEVRFVMEHAGDDSVVVDDTGSVTDTTDGIVSYSWSDGDTDQAGYHRAEFEITYHSGKVETFPNSGYIDIDITKGIN